VPGRPNHARDDVSARPRFGAYRPRRAACTALELPKTPPHRIAGPLCTIAAIMDDTDMTDVAYDIDIDVGADIEPVAQPSQPQQVVQVSIAPGCTRRRN